MFSQTSKLGIHFIQIEYIRIQIQMLFIHMKYEAWGCPVYGLVGVALFFLLALRLVVCQFHIIYIVASNFS